MALVSPKKYDWKDSNLALFGSSVETDVKKNAAEQEPAWKNAGKKRGLQIWRIVNFKVTEWPKEDYGQFYDGDSYIVLNTYSLEGQDQLLYDVHFWIGQHSTQDEYCTAAYKTVELDTFLDDVPIQHREVQGHESSLFKTYFDAITVLRGGADSGFRQVKPEEYTPRLLHFHGDRRGVEVREVPRCLKYVDQTDVYILDLGLKLIQWNGKGSNKDERVRAMQYLNELRNERGGKCKTETLDQDFTSTQHTFYKSLDETDVDDNEWEVTSGSDVEDTMTGAEKELYRLSDETGKLEFNMEKRGTIESKDFDSKDVFILDTKLELFVWIGNETTKVERKNAMIYAHSYLQGSDHPYVPVTCLQEGMKSRGFQMALAA